jgi:hypothetical protein
MEGYGSMKIMMDQDPDPGGPKMGTYGSYISGSKTQWKTLKAFSGERRFL